MTQSGFGFYFECAGRAAAQGAIDPAEQYFEGSRFEVSVARETGQNSLDAVDGSGTVRMEFELAEMATDAIPGIDELREHLSQVEIATRSSQGHDKMLAAMHFGDQPSVAVLRISDYGTTGLRGSESINDSRSPLSALTRGAGISANDGSRGGSFGIGSAVGPMASDLCTVFYTSLPLGEPEVVFAGYSRLASHQDASGVWRVGDGFFTELAADDFKYPRNPGAFGPFSQRKEVGTDLYVVGYRKALEDPDLRNIRDAFVDNFMMAIHEGRLKVTGKGFGGELWTLCSETLEMYASTRIESHAFYRAIQDPTPISMTSKHLGDVRLYINVDQGLPKTLGTITMRRPLMKIDTSKHTSIPAKYAAILVCDDPKGNTVLRDLEPPQHDCWDVGRAPGGPAVIKELKDLVRKALRDRVQDRVGDIVEIKGLSRFLPSDSLAMPADGEPARPAVGDGASAEASTVQGDPVSDVTPAAQRRKKVTIPVQRPARSSGGEPAKKGKDSGGSGRRKSAKPGIDSGGEPGDGRSRVAVGEVKFRSWAAPAYAPGRTRLCVSLTSEAATVGDIELVTLGVGGAPEPGYDLPILSAQMIAGGARADVQWVGNVFKDVRVLPSGPTRLEIELEAGHRYRLDVK